MAFLFRMWEELEPLAPVTHGICTGFNPATGADLEIDGQTYQGAAVLGHLEKDDRPTVVFHQGRRMAVAIGRQHPQVKHHVAIPRFLEGFGSWVQSEAEPGLGHVAIRPAYVFDPFRLADPSSIQTILGPFTTDEQHIGAVLGIVIVDDIVEGQAHLVVGTVEQTHDAGRPSGLDTAGTFLRLYVLETQSGTYQVVATTEYQWPADWSGRGGPPVAHLHYNGTERYLTLVAPPHLYKPGGAEAIERGGRHVLAVRFNFDFGRDLVLVETDVSETGHSLFATCFCNNVLVKPWHFQGTPADLPEDQLPYADSLIRGYVRPKQTQFRSALKNKLEEVWSVDPRAILGLTASDTVVGSLISPSSEGRTAPTQAYQRRFPYNTLDKRLLLWVSGLRVQAEEGVPGSVYPRVAVAQVRSVEVEHGQEFGTVDIVVEASATPSRDASTIDPTVPPSLEAPWATGLRFSDSGYGGGNTSYKQPNPTDEVIVGPGFVSSPPHYPGDELAWAAFPSTAGLPTHQALIEALAAWNFDYASLDWQDITGSGWSQLVSGVSTYAGEASHHQFFTPGGSLDFWYDENNIPFTEEEIAAFKAQFEPLQREPDLRNFTTSPGNLTGALRQLPWMGDHGNSLNPVQAPSGWIGTGMAEDVKKLYIAYAEPYQLLSGLRRTYQELSGFRKIFFRIRRREQFEPYDFPAGAASYLYEDGSPSGIYGSSSPGHIVDDHGTISDAQVWSIPRQEIHHRRMLACVNLTQNGLQVDWTKNISSYDPTPTVAGVGTSTTPRELDTDAFQVLPFRDKLVLLHEWGQFPDNPFPTLTMEVIGATENGFTDGGETWWRRLLLPGAIDDQDQHHGTIEQFTEDTTVGEGPTEETWKAGSYHWHFRPFWPAKGGVSPAEDLTVGTRYEMDQFTDVPWFTLAGVLYHRPTQKFHSGFVQVRMCPFGTDTPAPTITWSVSAEHIGGGEGVPTDVRYPGEAWAPAMAFLQNQAAWSVGSVTQTNQPPA